MQDSYGGPAGLQRWSTPLIGRGLAVVLDVVYNHFGPEGNYLGNFGPYFTDRYKTPWGLAINYDGPDSDAVRRSVVDNARHWMREFHVDGLRLDAVQAIFDSSATHILDRAGSESPFRTSAHLIAESDLNDPRLVRATRNGAATDWTPSGPTTFTMPCTPC